MPKDAKKNRYFQVGIEWDSWLLDQLEEDAKTFYMADQPAKLIVMRLTEYYKLVQLGFIIPSITAKMQPPMHTASLNGRSNEVSATNTTKRGGNGATPAVQEEHSTNTVTESDAAADNADAAFDFFKMDDDEPEE